MSVQRISVDVPDLAASVTGIINPQANNPEAVQRLGAFLAGIGGGAHTGKIRLNVGAVQAAGTITFASFADADTITLNGVTLTGKTSPSGASEWAVGASNQACSNNLVAKLDASTLDKIVGVIKATRRGTVALSAFVSTDTVTVNGVIFTGKTTPDANNTKEFAIGGSDALTAQNLLDAINKTLDINLANLISVTRSSATLTFNALTSLTLAASAHATVASDVVVITSIVGGQIGNLCTLAISARGSVSAANLAGGTEGTETIFGQSSTAI